MNFGSTLDSVNLRELYSRYLPAFHGINNETLVRRGEIMMDFDVIDDGWQEEELDNMNADDKEGMCLVHVPRIIRSAAWVHARVFHLPYGQTN